MGIRVILRVHIMTTVLLNAFRKSINRKKCTTYQRYKYLHRHDDMKTFPCSKKKFKYMKKIAHRFEAFRFTRNNFSYYIKTQPIYDPFLQTLFLPNLSTLSLPQKRNCFTATTLLKYSGN